ncbi:MAG TPA: metallophosphoesterase [Tepidisphaeraceae bacterium]|nr:metallophosphoesterase [Tepidisphaeraceae bacterium]
MRILAIGDIHGCSRALDCLLAAAVPRTNDLIITLGDYIDRGPDSAGTIERLLRLRQTRRVICLRGNHEQMMLDARKGRDRLIEWQHGGGDATLASYARHGHRGLLRDVPASHWDFLENGCVNFYETDTHNFVHAGMAHDLALADQPRHLLQWETFHDPRPHASGKIMVCGHTPQSNHAPRDLGHAICIDTHACANGWLTCMEVTTGYVWQATQTGQLRSGPLQEGLIESHKGA